jgi:hypothetical protein
MNKSLLIIPIIVIVIVVIIVLVSSSPKSTEDRCIVTVFSKKYDVTELRGTHPGGDIYQCGVDMSAMYGGQHGSNVERLEPYLVP